MAKKKKKWIMFYCGILSTSFLPATRITLQERNGKTRAVKFAGDISLAMNKRQTKRVI